MSVNYRRRQIPLVTCLLLLAAAALLAQTPSARRVVFIPYKDAKPILDAEAEILPQGLSGKTRDALEREWPNWISRQDAEIRTRLAQGDEDSLVNFLAFGTSYTRQPRVSTAQLAQLNQITDARLLAELSHDGVEFSVRRLDLWIESRQNGHIGFDGSQGLLDILGITHIRFDEDVRDRLDMHRQSPFDIQGVVLRQGPEGLHDDE